MDTSSMVVAVAGEMVVQGILVLDEVRASEAGELGRLSRRFGVGKEVSDQSLDLIEAGDLDVVDVGQRDQDLEKCCQGHLKSSL